MAVAAVPQFVPLISLDDDLVPATRQNTSPYNLQLGDCVFAVPPERVSVKRVSPVKRIQGLRAPGSVKSKTGQTQTEIRLSLWFNDAAAINGVAVPGPEGRVYYMDGLLALLAQFRRTPILPVFNELLNGVHEIFAVVLGNVVAETVPEFPGSLQVELVLYKTTIGPYLIHLDHLLADHINWPLFRWYYQQAIEYKVDGRLQPVLNPLGPGFTGDFLFSYPSDLTGEPGTAGEAKSVTIAKDRYQTVNSRAVMPSRELGGLLGLTVEWLGGKVRIGDKEFVPHKVESGTSWVFVREVGEALGYTVHWEAGVITLSKEGESAGSTWIPLELPPDVQLTQLVLGMSNVLADLYVQASADPSHQYLGGTDVEVLAVFETTNRQTVAQLEMLRAQADTYVLNDPYRRLGGYAKFDNELAALFGVSHVAIEALQADTVEGQPGLFRVVMSMISFDPGQERREKPQHLDYIEKTLADVQHMRVDNITDIYHACKAEQALDVIELYPDLELPTYAEVKQAMGLINAFRTRHSLAPIEHNVFRPATYNQDERLYVDPDFYIMYDDIGPAGIPEAPEGSGQGLAGRITPDDYTKAHGDFVTPVTGPKSYEWYDLGQASGLTATKINQEIDKRTGGRPHSKMKGMGEAFVEAERRSGLSAIFLVALAGSETEWGTSSIVQKSNNFYGIGAFDHNPDNALKYNHPTPRDGIINGALWIRNSYYAKGHKTLLQVKNAGYATSNNWVALNAEIMNELVPMTETQARKSELDMTGAGAEAVKPHWYAPEGKMQVETPLPQDWRKSAKINPTTLSNDDITNMMCRDMVMYSRRSRLVQAFPSFLLLFVDEGKWSGGRRLWTNFYAYHSLLNITLVRDRANPVDFLEIHLTNVYGNLEYREAPSAIGKLNWWQKLFPPITEQLIERRRKALTALMIKAGYRVHLRIGYGAQASQLPVAFNGVVTDFDAGEVGRIICQSDGQELVDPIHKFGLDQANSVFTLGMEPRQIFENILGDRGWMFHADLDWVSEMRRKFGDDALKEEYMFGASSAYGIEHFGMVKKEADGLIDWWFEIDKYDVLKNVYSTMYSGAAGPEYFSPADEELQESAGKNTWESVVKIVEAPLPPYLRGMVKVATSPEKIFKEANIQMYLGGKSPWDTFQICAKATEDYIVHPHAHQFHSTLFFGQPWWPVKFAYAYRGTGGSLRREDYSELSTAFSQFHIFSSHTDLIDNDVRASARRLVTACAAIYTQGRGSAKVSPVQMADHRIKSELQRTEVIDTHTLRNTIGPDGLLGWLGWNPGRTRAITMARNHIREKFREMYQGELVVLGTPSLKPYDRFYLSDHRTRMFGLAEAGRVVHHFGVDTGFVTAVKPDLCSHLVDTTRAAHIWGRLLGLGAWASYAIARKRFLSAATQSIRYSLATGRLTAALSLAGLRVVRNVGHLTAHLGLIRQAGLVGGVTRVWSAARAAYLMARAPTAAVQAGTGVGLIPLAIELAILAVINNVVTGFIDYAKGRNVIHISPLWYKDRPFVAGITGHQNLIPGWSEDGLVKTESATGSFDPTYEPERPGAFIWPTGAYGHVTSPFGMRRHPNTGVMTMHNGIDIGVPVGTPVLAAAAGGAQTKSDPGGYGRYIDIYHEPGMMTRYAHLSSSMLRTMTRVKAGQLIGYSGGVKGANGSGNSRAPHLHFEIHIGGKPQDPLRYVNPP